MERRLWIIRHGKSSWDYPGLEDIHRPLAERGIRNAADMARRMVARGMVPTLILSSPASRALFTALIMSRIWSLKPGALQIREPIYEATIPEIARVLADVPADITEVAVVGHNPASTAYTNYFLKRPLANLPTSGISVITLESDSWREIGPDQVTSTYVDYPKKKQK